MRRHAAELAPPRCTYFAASEALHRLPEQPPRWAAGLLGATAVMLFIAACRSMYLPAPTRGQFDMGLASRNLPCHRRHGCGGVSSAVAVHGSDTEIPPCDVEAINSSFWEPYTACYGSHSLPYPVAVSVTPLGLSGFKDTGMAKSVRPTGTALREGQLYTRFWGKVPPSHGRSRPRPCFYG